MVSVCLTAALLIMTAGCGDNPAVSNTMEPAPEADTPASQDIPEDVPEILPAVLPAEGGADTETKEVAEVEDKPLKELYEDAFRMGVAVQAIDHWGDPTAEIGNPDKEALICREFASITFGNEWKPAYNFDSSSPTLYKTDRAAEELLNWAKENGIGVRGHTLVWHSQCNPNIFAKDFRAGSPLSTRTVLWTARH